MIQRRWVFHYNLNNVFRTIVVINWFVIIKNIRIRIVFTHTQLHLYKI